MVSGPDHGKRQLFRHFRMVPSATARIPGLLPRLCYSLLALRLRAIANDIHQRAIADNSLHIRHFGCF